MFGERLEHLDLEFGEQRVGRQVGPVAAEKVMRKMRQATTRLTAAARARQSAVRLASSSTLQPDLRMRCSLRQRRA